MPVRPPAGSGDGRPVTIDQLAADIQSSAWIGVQNDTSISCRLNGHHDIEFSLGTWKASAELVFERYALERFVELAKTALAQPVSPNLADERPFPEPTKRAGGASPPRQVRSTE